MPATVFIPGAKWAFTRSYIDQWRVNFSWEFIVRVGPVVTMSTTAAPDYIFVLTVTEEWLPWSSNCYTLDFLSVDLLQIHLPSGGILPLPYSVKYEVLDSPLRKSVTFYDPTFPLFSQDYPLESSPPDYWQNTYEEPVG